MRSDREIAVEALRRADTVKARKNARGRMKAAAAAVFCLSFAVCIATLSGVFGAPVLHAAPQASVTMLDSAAVGGYVLVGVVCFVMGAAAMLYCRRGAKRKT